MRLALLFCYFSSQFSGELLVIMADWPLSGKMMMSQDGLKYFTLPDKEIIAKMTSMRRLHLKEQETLKLETMTPLQQLITPRLIVECAPGCVVSSLCQMT